MIAAEQKARATYDNILRVSDDPDVSDVIKFLREREVVHFQRFGEAILTHSNRFIHILKVSDFAPTPFILDYIILSTVNLIPLNHSRLYPILKQDLHRHNRGQSSFLIHTFIKKQIYVAFFSCKPFDIRPK